MRNRKKDDNQKPLPFDVSLIETPPSAELLPKSRAEAIRYRPNEKALDAIDCLAHWLMDPRSGQMTSLGEEALHAVRQALMEGRNGWLHKAEDMLEALAVRNGRHQGDDIPTGHQVAGHDFMQTIEDLLGALQERVVKAVRSI